MRVSGLSLPIGEQRRFESLGNPARVPNDPRYVEPNLAYVNHFVHVEGSQDRAYRGQVASTISSQPSGPSTDRSLTDTVGDTTLRLHK